MEDQKCYTRRRKITQTAVKICLKILWLQSKQPSNPWAGCHVHSCHGFTWSSMTTSAVAPMLSYLIGSGVVNRKLTAMPKSHPEQQSCSTQQKSCLVLKKKRVKKLYTKN